MSPKLYENHTFFTKNWIKVMGGFLFFLIIMFSVPVMVIGLIIWLISFGHFALYRLGTETWYPSEDNKFTFLGIDVTNIAFDSWMRD